MLVINDKIGTYLINKLFETIEERETELATKSKILETYRIESKEKDVTIEDMKYNMMKIDEKNCELKKKIVLLENNKTCYADENSEIVKLEKKLCKAEIRSKELSKNFFCVMNKDIAYNKKIKGLEKEIQDLKAELEVATSMTNPVKSDVKKVGVVNGK